MLRSSRIVATVFGLALWGLLGVATAGATPVQSFEGPLRLSLAAADFAGQVTPEFSNVRSFSFDLDFDGPLQAGRLYTNLDLREVRYRVAGGLETNPPTPSGFSAFALIRDESREGPISLADWLFQGSHLGFWIAADANLGDGVQLSELVPLDKGGSLLEINAREWGRLDRARYHPPELRLFADGTGYLRNANNDSKDTGTVNPATREEVHVDFGEEYITRLAFDPSLITVIAGPAPSPGDPPIVGGPRPSPGNPPVVPEPGTAVLVGFGLAGLGFRRR